MYKAMRGRPKIGAQEFQYLNQFQLVGSIHLRDTQQYLHEFPLKIHSLLRRSGDIGSAHNIFTLFDLYRTVIA